MVFFLSIIGSIGLLFLIIYSPVIYQRIRIKQLDQAIEKYVKEIVQRLNDVIVVDARPLGQGESQNSDQKFADVQKHQQCVSKAVNALTIAVKGE